MKLLVCDRNEEFIQQLNFLNNDPDLFAKHGDILSEPADAFVSPANSFGHMDGGIDLYYTECFGWHLQERLQKKIKETCNFNELLVGQAISIETDNANFPIMISAPTMRMPEKGIPVYNVFLSARAAIYKALELKLNKIVMPGMGTGVGAVPTLEAAAAIRSAFISAKNFYENTP